jgi:hypothetical protein
MTGTADTVIRRSIMHTEEQRFQETYRGTELEAYVSGVPGWCGVVANGRKCGQVQGSIWYVRGWARIQVDQAIAELGPSGEGCAWHPATAERARRAFNIR